jgi:hypothetical protein
VVAVGVAEPLALRVVSYAAAQSGRSSGLVVLLAMLRGTIWALQRRCSRSVLSALLAHLIRTPMVILLRPVV